MESITFSHKMHTKHKKAHIRKCIWLHFWFHHDTPRIISTVKYLKILISLQHETVQSSNANIACLIVIYLSSFWLNMCVCGVKVCLIHIECRIISNDHILICLITAFYAHVNKNPYDLDSAPTGKKRIRFVYKLFLSKCLNFIGLTSVCSDENIIIMFIPSKHFLFLCSFLIKYSFLV